MWAKVKLYFSVLWSEVYYKDHKTEEWHWSDCKRLLWFGAQHLPHPGNITAFLKCFFFFFCNHNSHENWLHPPMAQPCYPSECIFNVRSFILGDLGWFVRTGLLLLAVTVLKFSQGQDMKQNWRVVTHTERNSGEFEQEQVTIVCPLGGQLFIS